MLANVISKIDKDYIIGKLLIINLIKSNRYFYTVIISALT